MLKNAEENTAKDLLVGSLTCKVNWFETCRDYG